MNTFFQGEIRVEDIDLDKIEMQEKWDALKELINLTDKRKLSAAEKLFLKGLRSQAYFYEEKEDAVLRLIYKLLEK